MRAVILLAAGGSRRFGRANKLLASLGPRTVLGHALAAARSAPAGRVIIVTGADRARIVRLVGGAAQIVHNPRWRDGMASSIAAGMRALRPIEREVFVFLGDMPLVPHCIGRRLVRALRPGMVAARPVHRKRPGHPVLVRRGRLAVAQSGEEGLLATVEQGRVARIAGGAGTVADCDRRDALVRLRRMIRRGSPTAPNR